MWFWVVIRVQYVRTFLKAQKDSKSYMVTTSTHEQRVGRQYGVIFNFFVKHVIGKSRPKFEIFNREAI